MAPTKLGALWCTSMILAGMSVGPQAKASITYQDRGGYFEGVKGEPVSGERLSLIFAMVNYREKITRMPGALHLKFLLGKKLPAFPIIREKKNRTYYWLDQVRPRQPWRKGPNEFSWRTALVIQRLNLTKNLQIEDLVALVRVGNEEPTNGLLEEIAPAVLYHDQAPTSITSYVFGFRSNVPADVVCQIYYDGQATPIITQDYLQREPKQLFTVLWKCEQAKAGMYELHAHVKLQNKGQSFTKRFRFYHQPFFR